MGLTKTENFTAEQNELAGLAKVLGHPARIAIIHHLIKVNRCICGDIVGEIPLAQPTISRHLKELKSVGLIQGNIEGNSIRYCINSKRWTEIQSIFNQFFDTHVPEKNCT